MTWSPTEPQNTTKLRNIGVVIRPNWEAIEEADSSFRPLAVNLADRNDAGAPADPTAIGVTIIPYCKTDSLGGSELFTIDDSSQVIQLTQDGYMGSADTNIRADNIRWGSSTVDYGRNNMIGAYGQFLGNGTTVHAVNCTIARISTGYYQITFSAALANTNYVVSGACMEGGRIFTVESATKLTTGFRIFTTLATTATDVQTMFMVAGGY